MVPIDAAPIGKGRMAMTVREPLGVIGAITPFNVPFNLAMHKVGPALAAGNAVVHKPASATPLSALRLRARDGGSRRAQGRLQRGDRLRRAWSATRWSTAPTWP